MSILAKNLDLITKTLFELIFLSLIILYIISLLEMVKNAILFKELRAFWSKFETFYREINTEHNQIPKRYFNRWWELTGHNTLKVVLVFSCVDILLLKIGLKKPQILSKMAIPLF